MDWGGMRRIGVLPALLVLLAGCAAGGPATVPHDPAPEHDRAALAVSDDHPTPTAVMVSDAPTSTPVPQRVALGSTTGDDGTGTVSSAADLDGVEVAAVEPAGGLQADSAQVPARAAMAVADDPGRAWRAAPAAVDPSAEQAAEGPAAAPDALAPPAPPAAALAQTAARPPAPPVPGDGLSRLVTGGVNGRPEVALTFDAGADRGYAEAILDLLRDQGIPATFGMTGAWAAEYPDLVQRMVAEGHQLINHTWNHRSLTGVNGGKPAMGYWELVDELARTEQLVLDLSGYQMKPYFRPAYGDYDATTLGWLYDLGYPFTIMWTCDTKAWAGLTAWEIVERCRQALLPEDNIVLMHVGADAPGDLEALPALIDLYRQNGYTFVTAEQMLQP